MSSLRKFASQSLPLIPRFVGLLLVFVTVASLSGCGTPSEAAASRASSKDAPVHYVVTIEPLRLLLSELTAGRATVTRLLDPGASPHTYDPRPSDIRRAEDATALVYVDRSLDGWATRLPGPQRVAVFPLLPASYRLHFDDAGHVCSAGHDHHHHHGSEDAHFWTDPIALRALMMPLAERLAEVDPDGRDLYVANARAMEAAFSDLHDEIAIALMPVMGRTCVLFHPSFNYMFRRYGIESAAVVEPSPGQESSPAWLRGIIGTIREKDVKVIFTEPQLSPRPAQILAEATGIRLAEIDPIGARGNPQTIADFLRHNTGVLVEALE